MTASASIANRNARLTAISTRLNSGKCRIYSGTRPATADAALSGNTLLAELTLNATAFGAPAAGSMTANAVTGDTAADASGTATFFRLFQSDGTTVEIDGDCGTSGTEMILPTTSIQAGVAVNMTSLTINQP